MSAVPHATWPLAVLAAIALAVVFATLYGLWQAVFGRATIMAATSVAVIASVVTFYLVFEGLSLLTRRIEPFWLGLLASGLCFGLIFSRKARHQQVPRARVIGAVVLGLIAVMVLGAFCTAVGMYVGCQFSRSVLP